MPIQLYSNFLILTGAGISTESGIPDYRGRNAPTIPRQPMFYQEFVSSELGRQRYWARSFVGWSTMRVVDPNIGHYAVAELQQLGVVSGIITQNVDGLHQKAGTTNVVELHGSLSRVRCLNCGTPEDRNHFQQRMEQANPTFRVEGAQMNPDGDTELTEEQVVGFVVPACQVCGGVLKADVVFFGENVPKAVYQQAWEYFDQANSLLVLGTSLAVNSAFRFVQRAAEQDMPIHIINEGPTAGDQFASFRSYEPLGIALPKYVAELQKHL